MIRPVSGEKPTWGAPRILSELLLLGHTVAESTVAKYMIRKPKQPMPHASSIQGDARRSPTRTSRGYFAVADWVVGAT